jgi:hypothetical protein
MSTDTACHNFTKTGMKTLNLGKWTISLFKCDANDTVSCYVYTASVIADWVWSNGGTVLTGKKMRYWEKTLYQCHLPYHKSYTYTDLGSNSVSRGEKPVHLFRFLWPATNLTENAQRYCCLQVYSGLFPLCTVATAVTAMCKCVVNSHLCSKCSVSSLHFYLSTSV